MTESARDHGDRARGERVTRGTVLIVDDNPDNVGFLLEYLIEVDYRVLVALSGEEAFARLAKTVPDIILLDAIMPGMNGFEACARIKADPALRHLPVVFMSALTEASDKVKAFRHGAVDYVTKPVNKEEVLARVDTHVSMTRLQAELRRRNEDLGAFNRMLAHDLRTPLTDIIGRAELLADALYERGVRPGDQELEDIAGIGRSARGMNETLDALLLLAGVSQAEVALAPVVMRAVIADAERELAARLVASGARVSIAGELPRVLGYAPWLRQVWCNLLGNGIKYGGAPPVLEVGAGAAGKTMVRFWIRDNGPGIPAGSELTIFRPFTRACAGDVEGYGIGLSIVERIVARLGGEVGARRLPAGGSEFWFTLRRAG